MNFLKTTMLAGLFVLLPLMLLWIGLKEIGGLLEVMAQPIADTLPFPPGIFENLSAPGVVAFFLIAGTSFILGIAAKFSWIRSAGRSFERSVLTRIPMYRMLKIMSSTLVDTSSTDVDPALLMDGSGGNGAISLVYLECFDFVALAAAALTVSDREDFPFPVQYVR